MVRLVNIIDHQTNFSRDLKIDAKNFEGEIFAFERPKDPI